MCKTYKKQNQSIGFATTQTLQNDVTNLNNHQDQSHLEAHQPVATENRLCNVEFLSIPLAA